MMRAGPDREDGLASRIANYGKVYNVANGLPLCEV
jgi:hypothetical protein